MGDLLIQKDYAQDIDSCLIKRAEIEALNIADREIDLAWATEKSKVETQMDRFYKNIQHIVICGGTLADRDRWQQRYDMFDMAIAAMRVGESYMPHAERKEQFLKIYEDVTHDNELLVSTTASSLMLVVGGRSPWATSMTALRRVSRRGCMIDAATKMKM